ncbi:MAG TPA: CvpA family protein [Candidatus Dormibacteraeota bacterium]
MTLLDLVGVVLILVYAIAGWFTGAVRRVLGVIVFYVAVVVATNMGQQGGDILLQYQPTTPPPDARLYAYGFFLLLILVVLEGMAIVLGNRLQVAVVAFNRPIGLAVGAVTGIALTVVVTYMVTGFAQPRGGKPDPLQLSLRDMVTYSAVAYPLSASPLGRGIVVLMVGALPRDPAGWYIFNQPPAT